jgi:alpha-galactosidase/6-phospho-beta-glucosidase family protein
MNVVFVGGGSFRTLPIVRAAMADATVRRAGCIWLVDFNLDRAETVGRLILRTPEVAGSGCEVRWTDKPDHALPGADVENPWFAPSDDPTALVLKALGGKRQWLAASFPNRGAVKGFKDRTVLEHSMQLDADGIHPDADLEVPDCFHGLISSLASHQTLLADAIATRDPKLFSEALFAYPLQQNTRQTKALWRELLRIHAAEMPPEYQKASDYF